ncbi:MAG: hypothetical protein R6X05_17400 [Desulfobacterales bacterium]|jgi:thiol:disulfide interchange protein|nr:hypothetical protein [Desulfobacterales bacterium]
MGLSSCLPQKLSKLAIGILFLIFGTGTAILGVTVLPVIGLVLAAPLFIIGIYFIRTHLNKKCELPE